MFEVVAMAPADNLLMKRERFMFKRAGRMSDSQWTEDKHYGTLIGYIWRVTAFDAAVSMKGRLESIARVNVFVKEMTTKSNVEELS